jgi:hypothetical protein
MLDPQDLSYNGYSVWKDRGFLVWFRGRNGFVWTLDILGKLGREYIGPDYRRLIIP